jgi:hypothetical protein
MKPCRISDRLSDRLLAIFSDALDASYRRKREDEAMFDVAGLIGFRASFDKRLKQLAAAISELPGELAEAIGALAEAVEAVPRQSGPIPDNARLAGHADVIFAQACRGIEALERLWPEDVPPFICCADLEGAHLLPDPHALPV